jgi:hypothetical protein
MTMKAGKIFRASMAGRKSDKKGWLERLKRKDHNKSLIGR